MDLIKTVHAQSQLTQSIDYEYDFAQFKTLSDFVDLLAPIAFSVAAIMVSFYFIIGAFELITSQGDKGHIVSARAKIYHSIIGFVLLILIFLIMQYIPQAIGVNFSLF